MCRVLLDVYDSGDGDLTRIDELTANEDPAVSRLALQWASQAKENAGDVAGAIEAGQLALERCDDSDGPWTRALICGQLCGLATQVGDWPLAVRYARESLPVMEALGAAEDAIQLRSVIALADLSAGRLDEAAEELDRIAAGEHTDRTIGWSVAGISGQAELALARGEVDRGLSLYRECIDIARNRRMPGIDIPVDQTPWVMFAASSALFAHVLHGRRDAATDLASDLRGVLPQALDENGPHVDFPVCGGGLLALGTWDLTGGVGGRRDRAADDRARPALRLPPHAADHGVGQRAAGARVGGPGAPGAGRGPGRRVRRPPRCRAAGRGAGVGVGAGVGGARRVSGRMTWVTR